MNLENNIVVAGVQRNVSAFQPGVGRRDFQSNAITYGQLKEELIAQGFNLSNTRVTEGNTQLDLVNDDAVLPVNIQKRGQLTNDLIIVMTPNARPKSGSIDVQNASYAELKAAVKALYHGEQSAEARAHFGNYTQMKTEVMRDLLKEWQVYYESPADTAKFEEVRSKLESGDFKVLTTEVNQNVYNEALKHILYGVTLLQNAVITLGNTEAPSTEELEALVEKFTKQW